jgi:predicted DCC family thiol-disulfide oxidoreductase YuxK
VLDPQPLRYEISDVTTDAAIESLPPRVLFFDGVCVFCNWAVQTAMRLDRDKRFRYAALQGETADKVRTAFPEMPREIETFVYLEDGKRIYMRSRGIVRAARELPYPWRMLSWFRFVPAPIADLFYRAFASLRYRLFGKYEACKIPTPEERALFLP